jgi:hypothetical protein
MHTETILRLRNAFAQVARAPAPCGERPSDEPALT